MPADSPSSNPLEPKPPKEATLRQVAGAVLSSFFGVRKGRRMEEDTATIKPHQIIIVGVLAAVMFVLALIALVTFITRHA